MIEGLSALELRSVATGGGSLHVNGMQFSPLELRSIATGLTSGSILIISNAKRFSAIDMRSIATGADESATVLFQ